MIESQRRAYLAAMGYEVWVARTPDSGQVRLKLAPGQGRCLLVCPTAADTSTRLAGDIARALGGEACWAWFGDGEGVSIAEAVDGRLAVQVVVFGANAAKALFGEDAPGVLGSAALLVAPGMDRLGASAEARKALWTDLCRIGAPSANRT